MSNENGRKRFLRSNSRWRFGTKSAKNFKERVLFVGNKTDSEDAVDNEEHFQKNGSQNEPQMEFVNNQIKSSRYTIFTFLPK